MKRPTDQTSRTVTQAGAVPQTAMQDAGNDAAGADAVARSWWPALVTAVFTAVLAIAYFADVPFLDGPSYWDWEPRHLPFAPLWLVMLLPAALWGAGLWLGRRGGRKLTCGIVLLMAAMLVCIVTMRYLHRPGDYGFERVAAIIQDNIATSYYFDAARLRNFDDRLVVFTELMPTLQLHSKTHPPGPVLFFLPFIAMHGDTVAAAAWGGWTLGVLSVLVVPACFFMLRAFGLASWPALVGSALLAPMPTLTQIFPGFDAPYAALTCLLLGTWALTLKRNSVGWACAFGVLLATAVFFAYNLLVLGASIALYGLYQWWRDERIDLLRLTRHVCVSIFAMVLCYVALWLATGFDPIATFLIAFDNQSQLKVEHSMYGMHRPYHLTVWLDPIDFAKGLGWVILMPIAAFLVGLVRQRQRLHNELDVVALILLLQMPIVTLSGLLAAETARVWAFMAPLFVLAAVRQLQRWRPAAQVTFHVCLWVLAIVIYQNVEMHY